MIDFTSQVTRLLFPSAVYSLNDGRVHLTFDDGPHPKATPIVLDILNKFAVKATFFPVGQRAQEHPDIVQNIVSEGHAVGNHTLSHRNLLFHTKDVIEREIRGAYDILVQTTGFRPRLFRPPYGLFDNRTLKIVGSLGMQLVHWSNDLRDFKPRVTAETVSNAASHIGKGSIVLLHDNDSTAEKISTLLTTAIRSFRDRGLEFAALS